MKFQVGDRVMCVGGGDTMPFFGPRFGMIGTVVISVGSGTSVGVQFDDPFLGGHCLDGTVPNERGWWCYERMLECVETPEETDIAVNLEEVL